MMLYKFLQTWKSEHSGLPPQIFSEKRQFKEAMSRYVRQPPYCAAGRSEVNRSQPSSVSGCSQKDCSPENPCPEYYQLPENYTEALAAANTALMTPEVEWAIAELIKSPEALNINESSSAFWIMVKALGEFIDTHGVVPHGGSIPDMTANSDLYVELQRVYIQKAREDMAAMASLVGDILLSVGKPADFISDFELKTFCKNAQNVTVVRTSSIETELCEGEGVCSTEVR